MRSGVKLKAQGLSVQVAAKRICQGLDIEIAPGEIWGILGPNGSGKTTLLHTLGGLLPPQAGEITLAERALADYPAKQRARLLGILFQENHAIFSQTVWDYCLAGRFPHFTSFMENEADRQAALQALEVMQIAEKKQRNIRTLSGGEWRRLALATLLTQDPCVYLLDEPLNHLDLRHQWLLLRYLREQVRQKKIAVLMALHDINSAEQYCDRVLMVYGDGRTRLGTKEEVLTPDHLSELYGHPVRMLRSDQGKWWVVI